jgi:hypothetical protein
MHCSGPYVDALRAGHVHRVRPEEGGVDGCVPLFAFWGASIVCRLGQQKVATIESGAEIKVPLFIEIGDMIKVKCEDKEFMERVNTKK